VRDPGSSNSLSLDVFQRIIAVKIVTQIAIQHVGTGVMRWYEHAAAFAKKQTKPGFCRTARDGRRTAAIRHLIAPRFGLSPRRRRSWSRSRRPPCATSGHCLITPAALLVTSPNLWKRVILETVTCPGAKDAMSQQRSIQNRLDRSDAWIFRLTDYLSSWNQRSSSACSTKSRTARAAKSATAVGQSRSS
jgi:hypothetical protein